MFHTQWLNIFLFYLTCFPGIILLLIRSINVFKYTPEFFKYIFSLLILNIINLIIINKENLNFLYGLIFLLAPAVCYFFEFLISNKEFNFHIINNRNKIPLTAIFVYPLLEETNFRYNLFLICRILKFNIWQFLILSVLTFTFSHIVYQGIGSVKKIFFSTIQCVLFIYTQNLFFVVGTHILFNVLIYFDKTNRNVFFDF